MAQLSPDPDPNSTTNLESPHTFGTNDLRPAPLRIPQRRTDAITDDFEGTGEMLAENLRGIPTSSPHHQQTNYAQQCPSARTVVRRRRTGSKLGSLVSKFEILDAVNSAEASSNPRVSRGLKLDQQLEQEQQYLCSSMQEPQSPGDSSEMPLRPGLTPVTPERSYILSIDTRTRTTSSKESANGSFRHNRDNNSLTPSHRQIPNTPNGKLASVSSSRHALVHTTVSMTDEKPRQDNQLIANHQNMLKPKKSYSPLSGSVNASPSPNESHFHQQLIPGSSDLSLRLLSVHKASHEKSVKSSKHLKSPSIRTFETAQGSSISYEELEREDTAREHGIISIQAKSTQIQKPSVVDLRKSFEKISQLSTSTLTTPSKSKLYSEPPIQHSSKRRHDFPQSSDLFKPLEALRIEPPAPKSNDASKIKSSPLLTRTLPMESKSGNLGILRPISPTQLYIDNSPGPILQESILSRQRRSFLPTSNTSGTFVSFRSEPIKSEPRESEVGLYKKSLGEPVGTSCERLTDTSWVKSHFLSSPMDRPKHIVVKEPRTPPAKSILSKGRVIPRPSPKSEPATRRNTKVSDLRKLFDRPSIRGPSPIPFMNFRRGRGRTTLHTELSVPDPTTFLSTDSFATLSTPATCRKKVIAPELTTRISTNDFSCSFVDTPRHLEATVSESEYGELAGQGRSIKKDSPVKESIEHFERLDRGSPASGTVPYSRIKPYNTNFRFGLGKGEKAGDKKRSVGGWGPVRDRGTAMWRRISSSFGYSLVECDNNENNNNQFTSRGKLDKETTQPHKSPGSERRYRRSSIFGYHLYRPSEADRSTTYSSCGGSSVNINNSPAAKLENAPSCVKSYTSSSPQHLPVRKSFPLLARRISNRMRLSSLSDFGLDGALQSKLARDGSGSPPEDMPQAPSPSAMQSDPDALSKVMSRQSAAERWRRKQEEKQLRRGQKAKSRWMGMGKEKEKARESEDHDADQEQRRADKGKGKEVAAVEEEEEEEEEDDDDENGEDGDGTHKDRGKGGDKKKNKKKGESSWSKKTASGFVVRQANDVNLRHPKPRRPGQVKKIVNMYKEKASSGIKIAAKAASQHSVGNGKGGGGGGGSSSAA